MGKGNRASNSIIMWVLKDKKGMIFPGHMEPTRKKLKEKVEFRSGEPFETWEKYGWSTIKVRITEAKEARKNVKSNNQT